jgi:hypothetical protein
MADKRVRVLVGTRKGTYIVESDARRRSWKVRPPAHAGWDVFHVTADPRFPGTLYAAVNSGFWGPIASRSTDWGKTWKEMATPLTPTRKERKPDYEATSSGGGATRPVTNLWHFAPGHASEPKTLYVGVDPHMLFRSDDRGASWAPVPGINEHPTKKQWNPGFGGPCLHTVLIDPRDARRMYVGISSAGAFRSDDAGEHFRPVNERVNTPFLPNPYPEIGQCVHHLALDAGNPDIAYRQDHGGIYVNRHGMDGKWQRIGKVAGAPDEDFGFCVASPAGTPGKAYFVPLAGEARTCPNGGLQVWEWSEDGKRWKVLMSPKRFPGDYGVQREGISADRLDPAGIYVGTTTGQLVVSPDAGRSWQMVPFQFPAIHSVEASV